MCSSEGVRSTKYDQLLQKELNAYNVDPKFFKILNFLVKLKYLEPQCVNHFCQLFVPGKQSKKYIS